jgi:hypothetical protein
MTTPQLDHLSGEVELRERVSKGRKAQVHYSLRVGRRELPVA